jgi:hypothetical protein
MNILISEEVDDHVSDASRKDDQPAPTKTLYDGECVGSSRELSWVARLRDRGPTAEPSTQPQAL